MMDAEHLPGESGNLIMAQPNSNIIPFSKMDSRFRSTASCPAERPDPVKDRIRAQCRSLYSGYLTGFHREFFNLLDEELFSLSCKPGDSHLKVVYFAAVTYLRKERRKIENRLLESALKQFDEFWKGQPDSAAGTRPDGQGGELISTTEDGLLEDNIAVRTLIDKMNRRFNVELYGLDRRFALLLGRGAISREINPLCPGRICHGFEQVVERLPLELEVRRIIYRLYGALASLRLDAVYKQINAVLINAQILPTLGRNIRLPEMNSGDGSISEPWTAKIFVQPKPDALPQDAGPIRKIDSEAESSVFRNLQAMLDGWRVQEGLSVSGTRGFSRPAGGLVYRTDDVLSALSKLQAEQAGSGFRLAQKLKMDLTDQLRSMVLRSEEHFLAARDADIIDMVGMLFDFVFDDDHLRLPDPVKVLIGRLQIPIVKVAIRETAFFTKRSHPARALLNEMVKAGSELDAKSAEDDRLVAEFASIVERILTEYDQDVAIFSQSLERLNSFLEKETQHAQLLESRTRQVIESKEQLEVAKSKIGYALIRCIQKNELPIFIRSFLNDAWKHVMLLAYLRREASAGEWERASGVVTRLIWTITPVADIPEKRKILQEIPQLAKDICIGLEDISFDPHKTAVFFQELETCQMDALNELGSDAETVSNCSSPFYAVPWSEEARDPAASDRGPAVDIDALMAEMSGVDESLFHELDQGIGWQPAVNAPEKVIATESASRKPENPTGDGFIEQVRRINPGQWLSFKNENMEFIKAKLSWKSQVTSRCIFVNGKGAKVAEKTLGELAEDIRADNAFLIDNGSIPAVDRAVAMMMETLKKASGKSPPWV